MMSICSYDGLVPALYPLGALDFDLGLSALGVLERTVHDEYDGNPRRREIGEEQAQKHDKACGWGYVDLDIVPDQAGHDGADRDENHIEDECFHGAFRSVPPLILPLPYKEQLLCQKWKCD